MFSPIVAIVCFTHSLIVTLSFLMNGCSNNANSPSLFFTRPSTILDRICSGFDKRSSLCISNSVSFFTTSSGTSSIETYCT
uniref:Secreted protein n=1 Tax=Arundo donax TaxID=35708 RepID=A0A0A9CMG8_ARUDO